MPSSRPRDKTSPEYAAYKAEKRALREGRRQEREAREIHAETRQERSDRLSATSSHAHRRRPSERSRSRRRYESETESESSDSEVSAGEGTNTSARARRRRVSFHEDAEAERQREEAIRADLGLGKNEEIPPQARIGGAERGDRTREQHPDSRYGERYGYNPSYAGAPSGQSPYPPSTVPSHPSSTAHAYDYHSPSPPVPAPGSKSFEYNAPPPPAEYQATLPPQGTYPPQTNYPLPANLAAFQEPNSPQPQHEAYYPLPAALAAFQEPPSPQPPHSFTPPQHSYTPPQHPPSAAPYAAPSPYPPYGHTSPPYDHPSQTYSTPPPGAYPPYHADTPPQLHPSLPSPPPGEGGAKIYPPGQAPQQYSNPDYYSDVLADASTSQSLTHSITANGDIPATSEPTNSSTAALSMLQIPGLAGLSLGGKPSKPAGSPALQPYHGTYQDISPMPSPTLAGHSGGEPLFSLGGSVNIAGQTVHAGFSLGPSAYPLKEGGSKEARETLKYDEEGVKHKDYERRRRKHKHKHSQSSSTSRPHSHSISYSGSESRPSYAALESKERHSHSHSQSYSESRKSHHKTHSLTSITAADCPDCAKEAKLSGSAATAGAAVVPYRPSGSSSPYIPGSPVSSACSCSSPSHSRPGTPSSTESFSASEVATSLLKSLKSTFRQPSPSILTETLPTLTPRELASVKNKYKQLYHGVNLAKHIKSIFPTSTLFGKLAFSVALGPWASEAWFANSWYQAAATRNELLIESLMGKTAAETVEIKAAFRDAKYESSLEKAVQQELPDNKFRLAVMVQLACVRMRDEDGISREGVKRDVEKLMRILDGRAGSGETEMIEIIVNKSDAWLREVAVRFRNVTGSDLSRTLMRHSRNLVGETLLHILSGAYDRPLRDAKLLQQGITTLTEEDRADLLISRATRVHWDPVHLESVKRAFRRKYGLTLGERIKEVARGNFCEFLVKMVRED